MTSGRGSIPLPGTMELEVGDRIELVSMPDDPDPIAPGTQGTITRATELNWFSVPTVQYSVRWDDGRSLFMAVPPDTYRKL